LSLLLVAARAAGFPHIVRSGETVAQIAERVYGRLELERVIVAANGLDARAGGGVVAGMRLELPAPGHHLVLPGESWEQIADELLGSPKRGEVLAQLNGSKSWVPPAVGRELVIPYNLRFVASAGDTTQSLAYRFLGQRDRAWVVASYNGLERVRLKQGEVLLLPLTDLALTDEGRRAARSAEALVRAQAGGQALEAQRLADSRIPQLVSDVPGGRYVEAIRKGEGLLAGAGLSRPQLAVIYRQLAEAYVALDATGLAATCCAEWRRADPTVVLDPVMLSPKILRVCTAETGAPAAPDATTAPEPSASASLDPAEQVTAP
jgi:phage tail protein X